MTWFDGLLAYVRRSFAGVPVTVGGRDWAAFRENSIRLEAFRSADFETAMDGEWDREIRDTDGVQRRYAAQVQRIASDAASQYIRPPRRTFSGGTDGDIAKIAAIYEASNIDAVMLEAQQKAIPQQSVILTVDPDDGDAVRVRSWIPGEVEEIRYDDPLEDRIDRAARVVLTVPVGYTRDGEVVYGRRVYTREKCYTEVRNGREVEQRPLFGGSTANPFPGGRLPLVLVMHAPPMKGHALPAVRLDLLSANTGECVTLTDQHRIARSQCFGERTLSGKDAIQALVMLADSESGALSPDGVKAFDGEGLKYEIHNPKPDLKTYRETSDRHAELVARYVYASPEGLVGSTGITGDAKEQERLEVEEQRRRMESIWRRAEADLLRTIVMVENYGRPNAVRLSDKLRVHVDHVYVRPRRNDLQTAQAREIQYARGLADEVEDVAEAEGISEEEAAKLVAKRLGRHRWVLKTVGWYTPQGLDRVAEVVPAPEDGADERGKGETAEFPASETKPAPNRPAGEP